MTRLIAAALAILLTAFPALAGGVTNLVTNGDFDLDSYGSGNSGAIATPVGGATVITQNLTGWTMGYRANSSNTPGLGLVFASGQGDNPSNGAYTYLYGPQNGVNNGLTANSGATTTGGPVGQNGGNYVALDADPGVNGSLSQTITGLTAGNTYNLTFEWATAELVASNSGATTESVQVTFGTSTVSTPTLATAAQGFDPWRQATFQFVATNTSQVLAFLAVGAPAGNPPTVLLDAVALTVSEPPAAALMLTACAALLALLARDRIAHPILLARQLQGRGYVRSARSSRGIKGGPSVVAMHLLHDDERAGNSSLTNSTPTAASAGPTARVAKAARNDAVD